MNWSDVGGWLKENGGTGAALVGSILTGNAPAAIALGVKLVANATGHAEPDKALLQMQQDPQTLVRLRELVIQEQSNIDAHIEKMTALQLGDQQAEHHETQETIRNGDRADDRFVRWTRPGQSWWSLVAATVYAFTSKPDVTILGFLLALPFAYAGLRTLQHAAEMKAIVAQTAVNK